MIVDRQFCTFYLGGFFFGVPVVRVQEVIRYQNTTRVPLAPGVVSGVINLRGQIVMAINLRERLGMAPLEDDRLPMNVVIRTDDGVVSLLVDEIGDVLEVEDTAFEEVPETLHGIPRELIRGVFKLHGRLLLILDTTKTVTFDHTLASTQVS